MAWFEDKYKLNYLQFYRGAVESGNVDLVTKTFNRKTYNKNMKVYTIWSFRFYDVLYCNYTGGTKINKILEMIRPYYSECYLPNWYENSYRKSSSLDNVKMSEELRKLLNIN